MTDINLENIGKTYDFLRHKGETEIRLIDPLKKKPLETKFVKNRDEFIKICEENNGKYNVYVGIHERKEGGTKGEDVIAVRTIVFDIDSIRPDMSEAATDAELALAKKTADRIAKDIIDESEGTTPALMMSGNGYQIWLRMPQLDITDENRETIKTNLTELQKFMIKQYSGECKLDNIGDLPRIIKVAGTMSIKGSNTAERPWRLAKWTTATEVPENAKLRESLLKPIAEKIKVVERIKPDVSIVEIMTKFNPKIKSLFNGNISGYPSRSEAEMALVCELEKLGSSDKQIDEIMMQSAIGKWQEKGDSYKKVTIAKARSYEAEKDIEDIEEDVLGKPITIDIKEHYYQHLTKKIRSTLAVEQSFNIWAFTLGAGNKSMYLITKDILLLGSNELYMKRIKKEPLGEYLNAIRDDSFNKGRLVGIYEKVFGKPKKGEESPLSIDMAAELEKVPYFYEVATPYSEDGLKLLDEKEIHDSINNFVDGGYDLDPIMPFLFKADLVKPDPSLITPERWMPYSNHKIIFTHTKAGKSYMAERIGRRDENARIANLLGFSTAQDVNYGSLTGLTCAEYFDEIQEESDEQLWGKLLTFMEMGSTAVAKGKKRIVTKGYSSISFMGNPTANEEEQDIKLIRSQNLLISFEDMLKRITTNYVAYGSRIGVIVFNPDTKVAKMRDLDGFDKSRDITLSVFEILKKRTTNLWYDKQVLKWLNTPFEPEYVSELTRLAKDSNHPAFSKLIRGGISSYKHLRGHALKLAIVDCAYDMLHDNLDVEDLLSVANSQYQKCKEVNLDSFSDMIGAIDEKYMRVNYTQMFKQEPEHVRAFLYALKLLSNEVSKTRGKVFTRPEIDQYLDSSKNPYKKSYRGVPFIWENLLKSTVKTNTKLGNYHLYLTSIDGINAVDVRKWDALDNICQNEGGENVG